MQGKVDFLPLCENAAASEKANISLVPPAKAAGGYNEYFPTFLTA